MQINLKDYIKEVQDFPSKGIGFKDITPLLASPKAFGYALDEMSILISEHFSEVNVVAGIEARGFLYHILKLLHTLPKNMELIY